MGVDLGLPSWVVGAVAATLLLGSCTGDADVSKRPPPDPRPTLGGAHQGQAEARSAALFVSTGAVSGKLDPRRTTEVVDEVGGVVDDWLEAAYLRGPWPRSDFDNAWPRFSRGLKVRARKERAITSNAAIGPRLTGVRAEKRRVAVDILAARTFPAGATARVDLVLVTSGEVRQRVHVAGELYLTPVDGRWQIFGYDLDRSARQLAQDSTTPTESSTP